VEQGRTWSFDGDGHLFRLSPRRTAGAAAEAAGAASPVDAAGREAPTPKRFHDTVTLEPTRVGRDAGRIADEVVSHLVSASH
jgi:hypothetical protein